jgi:hypothetical protein
MIFLCLGFAVQAWVSYLNMSILIGTLAVALFNASRDTVARNFAYLYAGISVGILVRFLTLMLLVPWGEKQTALSIVDLRLRLVPASYHHDSQT